MGDVVSVNDREGLPCGLGIKFFRHPLGKGLEFIEDFSGKFIGENFVSGVGNEDELLVIGGFDGRFPDEGRGA